VLTESLSEWKSLSTAKRYASVTWGDGVITTQRTVYIYVVLDTVVRGGMLVVAMLLVGERETVGLM